MTVLKKLKIGLNIKYIGTKHRILYAKQSGIIFSASIVSQKDTRIIWKHLRIFTKNDNSSSNTLPDEIKIGNETYSDPIDTPDFNKLNDYVNSKVPSHIHFSIPHITIKQVTDFIRGLSPTKATGLDGLGPRILKLSAVILAPSITSLINKSIDSAYFPTQLKIAKIFPIHKSGSKSDPSNYRPISILPTISKLFEKHINKHLMGFLNKYNLIYENQSGFRPKHSCQTALIKLVDQWMTCINNGDIVGTLFIDFRKAFDLVDHSILLNKLSYYKFKDSTFSLFVSYLNNREQFMD